jgi:hypothetical protein
MHYARAAHAVVGDGKSLYAFAGTGAGGAPVLAFERFDGRAWHNEGSIPGPGLNAPSAVALNGKIYLIGGFLHRHQCAERRCARSRHNDQDVEPGSASAGAARRSRSRRARRQDSCAGRRQLRVDHCRSCRLRSREKCMDDARIVAARRGESASRRIRRKALRHRRPQWFFRLWRSRHLRCCDRQMGEWPVDRPSRHRRSSRVLRLDLRLRRRIAG